MRKRGVRARVSAGVAAVSVCTCTFAVFKPWPRFPSAAAMAAAVAVADMAMHPCTPCTCIMCGCCCAVDAASVAAFDRRRGCGRDKEGDNNNKEEDDNGEEEEDQDERPLHHCRRRRTRCWRQYIVPWCIETCWLFDSQPLDGAPTPYRPPASSLTPFCTNVLSTATRQCHSFSHNFPFSGSFIWKSVVEFCNTACDVVEVVEKDPNRLSIQFTWMGLPRNLSARWSDPDCCDLRT